MWSLHAHQNTFCQACIHHHQSLVRQSTRQVRAVAPVLKHSLNQAVRRIHEGQWLDHSNGTCDRRAEAARKLTALFASIALLLPGTAFAIEPQQPISHAATRSLSISHSMPLAASPSSAASPQADSATTSKAMLDEAPAGINSALSLLISDEDALSLPSIPTEVSELPPLLMPQFEKVVHICAAVLQCTLNIHMHQTHREKKQVVFAVALLFQMEQIGKQVLSNGLKVVLLEDHEVPLVRGSLLMRGGVNASPPDKVGLASMAMAVQRSGGSTSHPAPELDIILEQLAAGIEAGAGNQALSLDFYCGSEDLSTVLGYFSEVLRQPALPKDRLYLVQDQILNNLEHKNDDPMPLARRQLAKLMYGKDSIYARQPTKQGVLSVTVDDLRSFLAKWERPDGAMLGLVGDFEPAATMQLLEQYLGPWQIASDQPLQPPQLIREDNVLAPAAQAAGNVYLVDRPGLAQASVAVGEPGVSLLDPDAYTLDVLSTILNSFGGQLFDKLRSLEGLAYSVYGTWDTPPDRKGTFVGGGETSAPGDFIVSLRRELGSATLTAPTEEALQDAKSQVLNAFVFNFASRSAQLQRTLVYQLLDLPPDLLFRFRDAVAKVTSEDVLGAAQRHLHPNQQVTVVVGDAATVSPQLKAVGLMPVPLQLEDD